MLPEIITRKYCRCENITGKAIGIEANFSGSQVSQGGEWHIMVNKLTPMLPDILEKEGGSGNPKHLSKMKLTELLSVANLKFCFLTLNMEWGGGAQRDRSAVRQHEDKLLYI